MARGIGFDDLPFALAGTLEGVESVGVTSGASVPDELVQGVLDHLQQRGYPAAVEERLTEENLVFALPPELRKDLKRASA